MKLLIARKDPARNPHAFTLVELMIAMVIGLGLGGTVIFLLVQTGFEQRRALADYTVEQRASVLANRISNCLRSMSANQGLSPDYTTGAYDSNSHLLGYQRVYCFWPNTNGNFLTARIWFNPATRTVTYTPDMSSPANQVVWLTNSPQAVLRQLCFTTSFNPDGSIDNSLVNVRLQMDDNGTSGQSPTNNPASIYRNFSVQMRSD